MGIFEKMGNTHPFATYWGVEEGNLGVGICSKQGNNHHKIPSEDTGNQ